MDKQPQQPQQGWIHKLLQFYFKHYKALFILPLIILILACGQLVYQQTTTGDYISKGITLKGGVTLTIEKGITISAKEMEHILSVQFPNHELSVRELENFGQKIGMIIESDLQTQEDRDALVAAVKKNIPDLADNQYSLEVTGPSLGQQFFAQTQIALLIAFIFMAIVILIAFRSLVPSFAIVLAVFADIIITIAVFNMCGLKLSTAGIAAMLMIIGYAVDTNILLTAKLLKAGAIPISERMISAAKTGMFMTAAAILSLVIALLVTNSQVIWQIMFILIVGLLADFVNTWLQNTAILLWHLEKKGEKLS